jgi:hypothetical protein
VLWLPKWLRESTSASGTTEPEQPSRRTFLFLAGASVASLVLPTPPVWNERVGIIGDVDDILKAHYQPVILDMLNGSRVLFAGGRRVGKTRAQAEYMRLLAADGLRYPSAELSPSQAQESTWQSVDRNPNRPSFWVHPQQREFLES